jgi:hypothetical protein
MKFCAPSVSYGFGGIGTSPSSAISTLVRRNRLKALDRENGFRVRVNEVTDGFTWTIKDKRNFVVIDGSGAVYDCSCYTDYSGRDWTRHGRDYIKVTVSYPGTRKKSRTVSDHRLTSRWEEDEIVSVCPEGSKYLYRVLRDIKTGRFE